MKKPLLAAAVAALALKVTGATAAELPVFELMGFPISPHQVSVLGSAGIREQSPAPVVSLMSMPASPHQLAVLLPRSRIVRATATLTEVGSVP